ncbi:methyltransferase-like protein 9 [Octopus sinensis]|uniref:Methyltransferase-like protein 9 n=1 Tax=Octopus sinensis TaxID=2607531 RepID=A0A6P7SG58_9MOLL|nr:methyltransferase-like protein 9 [Octopus sinensis]
MSLMRYSARSSLAGAILLRMKHDEMHRNSNHSYWYKVNLKRIPEHMHKKFYCLHQDEETKEFLEGCYEKADWIFTQIFYSLFRSVLSWFMTNTSINAYLNRGSMFVYSQAHFMKLLGLKETTVFENLIDLGAGDGMVTKKMASYFKNVYVTEVSNQMKIRLKEKGFINLALDRWANGDIIYDVVTCLNLLDRCNEPLTILKQIKGVLRPGSGILIIALVFPFSPYVEENSVDHTSAEKLDIKGSGFEEQLVSFVDNVLEPLGYELITFSRAPYISEGDISTSFYVIDDAIFILKLADNTTEYCNNDK